MTHLKDRMGLGSKGRGSPSAKHDTASRRGDYKTADKRSTRSGHSMPPAAEVTDENLVALNAAADEQRAEGGQVSCEQKITLGEMRSSGIRSLLVLLRGLQVRACNKDQRRSMAGRYSPGFRS